MNGVTILSCWEYIHLDGRQVIIAHDSDWESNKNVASALRRLRHFLIWKKADVSQINWEVLANAAVNAVAQWRFEPPVVGGKPVLALASQEFNFGVR